jgi:AraC-like DNA-binding protein
MFTEARERGKNAHLPDRTRRIPTNSIPTGYCGTLRLLTPRVEVKLLSGKEGLVDAIADVDIPDAEAARKLSIKVLPSTTPFVLFQYRVPIGSSREFDGAYDNHGQYGHVASHVRCGVVTVRAFGPIGVVVVRLRPEAAPRFLGSGMGAFANVKIGLRDMLERGAVCVLEEKLAGARTSIERITLVTDFLRANLRERDPDPLVSWAAEHLRHNPVRIRLLAAELGISERHLSRRFHAIFGINPKEFARTARLEKVLAARAAGLAWADLSYACGFADQAHMINDTRRILGASPEQVLAPPLTDQRGDLGASDQTSLFMW